jgi:hypothetical protein
MGDGGMDKGADDYDSPWKEALEHWFPEFLALLFPSISAEVDWLRGYQFLDKMMDSALSANG